MFKRVDGWFASALVIGAVSLLGVALSGGTSLAQVMSSDAVLTSGTVGMAYTMPAWENNEGSYQWQVSQGSLPEGLRLDPMTGQLMGTPLAYGTSTFRLTMMDTMGHSTSTNYSLYVQPSDFMRWSSSAVPAATLGQPYTFSFTGSQVGSGPWTVLSGGLPSGLILSSNGTIQGTPTMAGRWMFRVQGANGDMILGERTLMIDVLDPAMDWSMASSSWYGSYSPTYPSVGAGSSPVMTGMDQATLVQNLNTMGISTNSLVRAAYDPSGVNTNLVYFIGHDGKRHPFNPDQAFGSWYQDMSTIRTIDFSELARIPLGAAGGYRPGSSIIRFQSSPDNLYVVQPDGMLRPLDGTTAASSVYGMEWMNRVQTLSDGYYGSYQVQPGNAIMNNGEYDVTQMQARYQSPADLTWSTR